MCRKWLAVLILALAFTGCSGKSKLVLYTWTDMFPPDILSGFERDTGRKIQYVIFDTNETMIDKVKAAKGGKYDLIIADDYMLENVVNEGLARRIDRSRLSNYDNINPRYQGQFYDPADEYTIPYGAGILTIVYDPQKAMVPMRGYYDLWHPQLARRLGIVDNFRVINGMALKVMGESYNTNDSATIRAAGEYLKILAPNIRLIRDDKLEDALISGEIFAAVMYTSQVTMAKIARPDLKVVFPAEGLGFGIMAAFIPVNSPNAEAAYAFLDYILDARRGAACFEYLGYYSTFSASDSLIDPEYRNFLTLPHDLKNVDSMEMIRNVSDEAEAVHSRVWAEFKSAAGR